MIFDESVATSVDVAVAILKRATVAHRVVRAYVSAITADATFHADVMEFAYPDRDEDLEFGYCVKPSSVITDTMQRLTYPQRTSYTPAEIALDRCILERDAAMLDLAAMVAHCRRYFDAASTQLMVERVARCTAQMVDAYATYAATLADLAGL